MGKGGGLSPEVQQGELANSTALTQIAQQQAGNANTLFNVGLPGVEQASSFYEALASGDPSAIARATAPATQQADIAAAGAKQNILQNGPAGGEKNLALEQVDVNRGAQVGKTASESYLNSFNALASLGGQNIGSSNAATSNAVGAYNSSSNTLGTLGNLQVEQKGAQLGALSSLGGDAATLGGAWIDK